MKIILKKDPRIIAKEDDLLHDIVVIRVNKFNDEAAKDFSEDISDAHNTGQPIIPVIIDSYGGEVYSLLAMIAEIDKSDLPIATIAVGKAMSCGSVLLACGTPGYRYCSENARIMIHDVSSMSWGKVEEIKAEAKETDFLNQFLFTDLARRCGHKDENYFLNKIHEKNHAEWYMGAKECKRQKLIDKIGVPTFKTTIKVEMTLE